jgi:hypothetical protein
MFTRKLIASTVAAATLATGGLAVAALNPLSTAGAEEQPAPDQEQQQAGRHRGGRHVLKDVLDGLVADGTLTQAQADAVTGGVKDEVKDRRAHRRELVGVVADTIGVSTEDLVAALKDGKSIAQVAEAHDVTAQAVVDALVANGVPEQAAERIVHHT